MNWKGMFNRSGEAPPELPPRPARIISGEGLGTDALGSRSLAKLRGYHDLAKEALDKALTADARNDCRTAIKLYQAGVQIITEGLGVELEGAATSSPEAETARRQMAEWSANARDRIWTLDVAGVNPSRPQSGVLPRSAATGAVAPRQAGPVRSHHSGPAPPAAAAAGALSEQERLNAVIEMEIVDRAPPVRWADIAGLEGCKRALHEAAVLPTIREDLFQGLRAPASGLLLFGPPGTGKTLLAKAVASESGATFFAISAASLTSKWVGEGEKLVRALFGAARARAPAIVFVDEIDALLSARSSTEHDASRRLKTEFLVQLDGITSAGGRGAGGRVVILGATNRPEELDEAVLRRLPKRIFVPLPDAATRRALLQLLLKGPQFRLPAEDVERLVARTEGFSGSDLAALAREAAMEPLRELPPERIATVQASKVRPLVLADFEAALRVIRPSADGEHLKRLEQWAARFGAAQ